MRRLLSSAVLLTLAACGAPATAPTMSLSATPTISPDTPVATLSFNPAALTLQRGQTGEVKLVLDLQGRTSTTYQAEISFDPKVIEIVDADSKTAGIQVTASMYEQTGLNTVDAAAGRIKLLGFSPSEGKEATGRGNLAVITVRAKAAGSTELKLDRINGDTHTKTKVILKGTPDDILASVSGMQITVQ